MFWFVGDGWGKDDRFGDSSWDLSCVISRYWVSLYSLIYCYFYKILFLR